MHSIYDHYGHHKLDVLCTQYTTIIGIISLMFHAFVAHTTTLWTIPDQLFIIIYLDYGTFISLVHQNIKRCISLCITEFMFLIFLCSIYLVCFLFLEKLYFIFLQKLFHVSEKVISSFWKSYFMFLKKLFRLFGKVISYF